MSYYQGRCMSDVLLSRLFYWKNLMPRLLYQRYLNVSLYQRCLIVKVVVSEMSYCQGCHIEVVIPDRYRQLHRIREIAKLSW